ncbi:2OG-Fe(II) oxygenase [Caldovatus aquaticus]|uniref:2OG-Fe(II) oxygenase n=1 Tax=Caldovatus aquaticus TaxID=2865671 RepID=A0ABS7F6H3_9PROT|nr:2OG-Fe(II) oxygenase [Caldovatus aquaticus]
MAPIGTAPPPAATGTASQASEPPRLLDLRPFLAAPLATAPYPHLIASGCLHPEAVEPLRRDFPDLRRSGFHPTDSFTPRGAFAALLAELEGPELAAAMTARFGLDFAALPRLVTVRRLSAAHEGAIHTDSARKVATLLLYLNPGWSSPDGRLRVLRRGDSFADPVAEISPEEGTVFAFLRTDTSWHGHTPFVGERRVVQIAWLRDASDLERKRKRHRLSLLLKTLFRR